MLTCKGVQSQQESTLCVEVSNLSLNSPGTTEGDATADSTSITTLTPPSSSIADEPAVASNQNGNSVGMQRLEWYDKMLPFAAQCDRSILDWKAWANCGACLYKLGEKKASWDAYKQAALAAEGFQREFEDHELVNHLRFSKFFRQLDREFHVNGWATDENCELGLFVVLVQLGRASEIATQRWHETLPNHYFAVTTVLARKLSTQTESLEQLCTDDSRMELQQGNFLALLGSPAGLFVETSASKRAKLASCVRDIYVKVQNISTGATADFEVEKLDAPPDDES